MLAGRLLKNFHDGLRTIRLLPDNTNQEIAKRPPFLHRHIGRDSVRN
jgi:hypothetical protein